MQPVEPFVTAIVPCNPDTCDIDHDDPDSYDPAVFDHDTVLSGTTCPHCGKVMTRWADDDSEYPGQYETYIAAGDGPFKATRVENGWVASCPDCDGRMTLVPAAGSGALRNWVTYSPGAYTVARIAV